MIRSSRNVYIVENINSGRIEQAIFILKPGQEYKNYSNEIAAEAERIINNYITKLECEKSFAGIKKKNTFKKSFFAGIFTCFLTIVSILIINALR